METPTVSPYARGAVYGLIAVCIWAAFIGVSRLGVRTSLTPWDVAATRFTIAGVLLLPYLVKRGLALDRLGRKGLAAIEVWSSAHFLMQRTHGNGPMGQLVADARYSSGRLDLRDHRGTLTVA